jgi:hypothetical protein
MVNVLILLDPIHVIVHLVIDWRIKRVLVSSFLLIKKNQNTLFFLFKDIDECTEPNVDGSYTYPCNVTDQCIDGMGNFTCECSPVFNTSGTCNCMYN